MLQLAMFAAAIALALFDNQLGHDLPFGCLIQSCLGCLCCT